ncbi:MAG TPA: hypothetical protein VNG33_06160, partial [Polyangiaceae bacterium]|nr:hypothetical protein [Polyangiaceae bacterium]
RSPFRNPDGSFTKDALAGREIFLSAGCAPCHSGPDFTDSPLNVLHDVGTLLPTSGMRLGATLTGIDTPTLKGLWQTAPYLHDGRAASLQDVFAITGDQMGVTGNLTKTELEQLVRYLLELDDVPETVVAAQPMPMPDALGMKSGSGSSGETPRASSASCALPRGSASSSAAAPAALALLLGWLGLWRRRAGA